MIKKSFFGLVLCLWMAVGTNAWALYSGDYVYTESEGKVTITTYNGPGGDVVIPGTINGMPVVSIDGRLEWYEDPYDPYNGGYYYTIGAFENMDSVTSIIIPDSVTTIGTMAFYSCNALASVTFGTNVDSIGTWAFGYCYSLNNVILPDSLTSIGDWAFCSCDALTNITLGNSVESIGQKAFYGCEVLNSINFPDSIISIDGEAFGHCSSLTSVALGNSVASIEKNAFSVCSNLTSITVDPDNSDFSSLDGVVYNKNKTVLHIYPSGKTGEFTIPDSVTNIESYAFYICENLSVVTIPGSVTNIGERAFVGCSGLTTINIPDSVSNIENSAFSYCNSLTSVTIPGSVTSIGDSTFSNCANLSSVIIGNGVSSIGPRAFYNCDELNSMTIPNSVTTIGSQAFGDCSSLASVTIPGSVTNIESYAFWKSDALSVAYFLGDAPLIGYRAFDDTAPDFTVCYTSEAIDFETPTWEGYPAADCACSDDTDCAEGEMCTDGACEIDIDSDGIINAEDNCPDVANPDQENVNAATEPAVFGDACDPNTVYGTISGDVQEGVTVRIYKTSCGDDIELTSDTTDSGGYYSFGNLGVGYRTILPELEGYTFAPEAAYTNMPQSEIQSYDFRSTVD